MQHNTDKSEENLLQSARELWEAIFQQNNPNKAKAWPECKVSKTTMIPSNSEQTSIQSSICDETWKLLFNHTVSMQLNRAWTMDEWGCTEAQTWQTYPHRLKAVNTTNKVLLLHIDWRRAIPAQPVVCIIFEFNQDHLQTFTKHFMLLSVKNKKRSYIHYIHYCKTAKWSKC